MLILVTILLREMKILKSVSKEKRKQPIYIPKKKPMKIRKETDRSV